MYDLKDIMIYFRRTLSELKIVFPVNTFSLLYYIKCYWPTFFKFYQSICSAEHITYCIHVYSSLFERLNGSDELPPALARWCCRNWPDYFLNYAS